MSKHRPPSKKSIREWRQFCADAKAGRIKLGKRMLKKMIAEKRRA